mgnify:FL=1
MKIGIDAGHGGRDPGAVGQEGLYEKDVVLLLAQLVAWELRNHHEVIMSRTTDTYMTVGERVRFFEKEGVDVVISLHINASDNPAANGTEVLYFPSSTRGKKLAQCVQTALVNALGTQDRKIKPRVNLGILSDTSMPAILVEPEFISNPAVEKEFRDTGFLVQIAKAVVAGFSRWELEEGRV